MQLRSLLFAAAFATLATGCGETTEPPAPTPGALTVSLEAPPGVTTGALVFSVEGPGSIGSVNVVPAGAHAYSRPAPGGVKVAVFGTLTPGAVVRFDVPDTRAADEYAATLIEAAGTDNELKPLTGYGLGISD